MFDKLEELEARYEEIERRLSDPETFSDASLFRTLSKERADATEVVEAYRRYKGVLAEIEGNEELLAEDDAEMRAMAEEELTGLRAQRTTMEEELQLLLLPKDPRDEKNVLLEIRAGAGGDEAALFAADLFRMYTRYAERQGWKLEIMDQNATGVGGFKEIIALIEGQAVFHRLKYESGVHRVQRVPVTESSGRIHTSTATVAIMPEAEEVELHIDEQDLRIETKRASGPGGQSVNTTDSAIVITHLPTGERVSCQDEKSQHKNKAKAMKVLRSRLLEREQAAAAAERAADRRGQVGTGDRSEKIRTYNFPQSRVTDHRIGRTQHNLEQVIDGELQSFIDALHGQAQLEALQQQQERA